MRNAATATTGVSYNAGTNTLTFDNTYVLGSFDFTLTATNDTIVDSGETFAVTANGATITNGTVTVDGTTFDTETVTINDVDQAINVTLVQSTATVNEESGTTSVTYDVDLDGVPNGSNTVSVVIGQSAGTATDGTDFTQDLDTAIAAAATATTGVSYNAGTNTLTFDNTYVLGSFDFTLTATNDTIVDSGETFAVTANGATITNGTVTVDGTTFDTETVTINDVDQAINVTLVQSTATVNEESGTTSVTYDVDLDAVPNGSNTVSVVIAQSAGTATDGTDFTQDLDTAIAAAATATTGVSYNAGTNTLTFDNTYVLGSFDFTLTATNDTIVDSGETFAVTANGATITNGTVTVDGTTFDTETVTINDVDQAINVTLVQSTATVNEESGTTSVTYDVDLDAVPNGSNTVSVVIASECGHGHRRHRLHTRLRHGDCVMRQRRRRASVTTRAPTP